MRECLDAALRYAARGWSVFPLNGKLPFAGTHGHNDATTDRATIKRWWKKWPSANVGIACSSTSGPIVIDLDKPANENEVDPRPLVESLDLPETREASSRKGRLHLYFDPMLDGTEIARMIRPFKDKRGKKYALDILGDGGYVVAPPSVHPDTGREYKWLEKRKPAPFPEAIFQLTLSLENQRKIAPPVPDIIGEGERDQMLTSLAGSMRRRNADEGTILAALREMNNTRVRPPLSDKQVVKIAKSISKKEPVVLDEHLTDLGNARRFVTQHEARVRSVMVHRHPWLIWDGRRYAPDTTGEVERMAKQTVRSLYAEASQSGDEEQQDQILKHAVKSESAGKIRALIELAATEPELSIVPDKLDANPYLLNLENGTFDLRKMELRKHKRRDLITKLTSVTYDPNAQAPRWHQFLHEVMNGDDELVEFVQRAVGYSLTGDTREHCLFFCYGQGRNGKSTMLEVLRVLLGDYAQQADFSSFLARQGDGPRNDLARMRGARLVTASEADSDKGFDGRMVKMLTGADTIVARRLYEEHFEFMPQHKLWLAANHKPLVKEQTEGFWSRIRLIPFTVVFDQSKQDKKLMKKLTAELPGILNWAIEGCERWRKNGLIEPRAVQRATRAYREENDVLGEFISQCAKLDGDSWTSTTVLYRTFCDWWTDTRGHRTAPISLGWFGRLLSERVEITQTKRNKIRGWRGIAITITVD